VTEAARTLVRNYSNDSTGTGSGARQLTPEQAQQVFQELQRRLSTDGQEHDSSRQMIIEGLLRSRSGSVKEDEGFGSSSTLGGREVKVEAEVDTVMTDVVASTSTSTTPTTSHPANPPPTNLSLPNIKPEPTPTPSSHHALSPPPTAESERVAGDEDFDGMDLELGDGDGGDEGEGIGEAKRDGKDGDERDGVDACGWKVWNSLEVFEERAQVGEGTYG
ncbi:hypothetical protein HK097_005838, partial [Rhizophlyctis rosea]